MNVLIDANTERRLWALIRTVDTEIGGWGYARLNDRDLIWNEVFLVPQEVSHSEVDFEATGGDAAAIERATNDGVLEDPTFVWVSWHSHHSMDPFWSKTDAARIAAIAKTGVTRLLSFVGCHGGDYRLRLDVFDVQAQGVSLGQVSLEELKLVSDCDDEFSASLQREIAANVKELAPPSSLFASDWTSTRPAGQLRLPPSRSAEDDRTLGVAEAFAVTDLMDHDFTYDQAMRALDEIGVEGVDDLVESGDPFGPDAALSRGGCD
jgi:hypothetical protein